MNELYVVTVMLNGRVIDVSVFENQQEADFYAGKWDLDHGLIQIHKCTKGKFRGSEII